MPRAARNGSSFGGDVVNAILYQGRTGCQWDFLPHDLTPRSAVYYYSAKWRDDGTDQSAGHA